MRQQLLAALVGQEQAIERYALRLDLRQQLLQLLLSLFIAQTADIFGFFSHFAVLSRQTCLNSYEKSSLLKGQSCLMAGNLRRYLGWRGAAQGIARVQAAFQTQRRKHIGFDAGVKGLQIG